jgi:hypothetical protein
VDLINAALVRFAHRNVFSNTSSPEIQTLVDREIDQAVFGQNAFAASIEE